MNEKVVKAIWGVLAAAGGALLGKVAADIFSDSREKKRRALQEEEEFLRHEKLKQASNLNDKKAA